MEERELWPDDEQLCQFTPQNKSKAVVAFRGFSWVCWDTGVEDPMRNSNFKEVIDYYKGTVIVTLKSRNYIIHVVQLRICCRSDWWEDGSRTPRGDFYLYGLPWDLGEMASKLCVALNWMGLEQLASRSRLETLLIQTETEIEKKSFRRLKEVI
jgi:hypothetical protein